MSATGSAGYGHGPYGKCAFGHGPWLVWPHTPHPGWSLERTYDAIIQRYADGTEARYRRARTPRETLTMPFIAPDSATVSDVRTWVELLGGGATRVVVEDPHARRALVARLAQDDALTVTVRDGAVLDVAPLQFTIERPRGYAREVYALSPRFYWRCSERTGVSTLTDATPMGLTAAHVPLTSGGSTGQAGLLARDPSPALLCRSLTARIPLQVAFISQATVAAMVRLDWPPTIAGKQPLIAWFNSLASSQGLMLCAASGGIPQVTYGSSVLAQGSTGLLDNAPHHVAWACSNTAQRLWVDGVLVASATETLPLTTAVSGTLGACVLSAQYLYGSLSDIAVWTTALTDADVLRMAAAARDP